MYLQLPTLPLKLVQSGPLLSADIGMGSGTEGRSLSYYTPDHDCMEQTADVFHVANLPTTGWSFRGMANSTTMIFKAPPTWHPDIRIPLLVEIPLATFMRWQPIEEVGTLALSFLYDLSQSRYIATCEPHLSKLQNKILQFSQLVEATKFTPNDHGSVFDIVVPGTKKVIKALYVLVGSQATFVRIGKASRHFKGDFTHFKWAIRTDKVVAAELASSLSVVSPDKTFTDRVDTLSISHAIQRLPSLNLGSEDAQTLKTLQQLHFTWVIGSQAIGAKKDNVELSDLPLPSILRSHKEFYEHWTTQPFMSTRRPDTKVVFMGQINPKTRKYRIVMGVASLYLYSTVLLPEMSASEFQNMLLEWFSTDSGMDAPMLNYGIMVRCVDGQYISPWHPTALTQSMHQELDADWPKWLQ